MNKIIPIKIKDPLNANGLEVTITAYVLENNQFILIDAGLVETIDILLYKLNENNLQVKNLYAIILTHLDHDHIGNVSALKKINPHLKVMAAKLEAPYLEGKYPNARITFLQNSLNYTNPVIKADYDEKIKKIEKAGNIQVDIKLVDNQYIEFGQGLEIILTPGHTWGHLCVLIKEFKTLVSGDIFIIFRNKLILSNEKFAFNYQQLKNSAHKLLAYDFNTIITAHGGLYTHKVKESIENLLK